MSDKVMNKRSSKPLISIIIPCYNYGHYLDEAIQSVKAQTYTNWECLIIDDGSTDNTMEIAQKYVLADTRFSYYYQENRGLSAARNTGIQKSAGEYLQFLDADDLIENMKLEIQEQYLELHPEHDAVVGISKYFQEKIIDRNCNDLIINSTVELLDEHNLLELLIKGNIMCVHAPLLRRSIFDTVGNFNETLRYLEDWEYWLRCAISEKNFIFLNVSGTAALVRSHSDSLSKKVTSMLEAERLIRQKLLQKEIPKALKKINENDCMARLGIRYIQEWHIIEGIALFMSALRKADSKLRIMLYLLADFRPMSCRKKMKSWAIVKWIKYYLNKKIGAKIHW